MPNNMTVSHFIADFLVENHIDQVFMLTGGGAMFLNDALGQHPDLSVTFCHHEQALAMAADAYARICHKPAVVNVTTGPGGINALNGVFGAWTDSIPMIIISGQVKRSTLLQTFQIEGLRQIGDQEADIISMAKGICKYATCITEAQEIPTALTKAIELSTTGRPGPVWLDLPMDIQSASIEASVKTPKPITKKTPTPSQKTIRDLLARLKQSKRPVFLVGNGINIANAKNLCLSVFEQLNIPACVAWTGIDVIPNHHPCYCGRAGTIGDRGGNFTVQNADLLIVLGSRLNIRQVSYNWEYFARDAHIVQVDIDPIEMTKPTIKPNEVIISDLHAFLDAMNNELSHYQATDEHFKWLNWAKKRTERYPVVLPKHRQKVQDKINPYYFVELLSNKLKTDDIIVCANGAACVIGGQVFTIQEHMRLIINSGSASMGYDLPAAIGAAIASKGKRRIICLAGEGSVQMNLQELQTIQHYQLPISLFILNNGGYSSIRQTQQNFFGRLTGEGPQSDVTFPNMEKIAQAYGFDTFHLASIEAMKEIHLSKGPALYNIQLDETQGFEPKVSSKKLSNGKMISAPLEDMAPFLERDEFLSNMLIPVIQEE